MRIFDNLPTGGDGHGLGSVGARLTELFDDFRSMDVATGYFDLRGWGTFDEAVRMHAESWRSGDAPLVRILIGMATPSAHDMMLRALDEESSGLEQKDADREVGQTRRDAVVRSLREQLSRGRTTARIREELESLRDLVERGVVEMKAFTRRPLHGKTYVLHRDDSSNPVTALVGSSNMTGAGLFRNLELNAEVTDRPDAEALATWFEDRWTDHFSMTITKQMLALLEQSFVGVHTPYEIFLKVCYDLSQDVREGLEEYSVYGRIDDDLLEYQRTAVTTLARRVEKNGGAMLGDVVGLGKTITAVAVASMLRDTRGYRPLVVCPKNLVKMWQDYLHCYDINGGVVSYTTAHRDLPEMRRFQLVILDESHALRNSKRRDYQAVHEYIERNESKVLELTATPYNLSFLDVANQLALFIGEDADLGVTPQHAMERYPEAFRDLVGKERTLEAFRKSEEPEDWKRLMGEMLVRRTRGFIRRNYAEHDDDGTEFLTFANGSRFTFPERVAHPVDVPFEAGDPASLMTDEETLDTLQALLLPRFRLADYVDDEEMDRGSAEDRAMWEDWKRARSNAAGFVRTGLYKRLSSCGYAFDLSLRRQLARDEMFVWAIDNGRDLPVGTIDLALFNEEAESNDGADVSLGMEGSSRPERLYTLARESASRDVRWVRPTVFKPEFREDLEHDNELRRGLLRRFGRWEANRDTKLARLHRLLTQTRAGEKVLVFTEYKDTAEYLGRELATMGVERVAVVTGSSEDPTALAWRFSPESNASLLEESGRTIGPDEQLDVLIATDVLSEGQNLQDSHVIVNYDLPWAIIRLIQRAGRVDRIGQRASTVDVYSIFHGALDGVLSLRERIARRLGENASAFGSDERFFGTKDEVGEITDLYEGRVPDEDDADDVDAASRAFEIWREACEREASLEQRIPGLPDLIDSTRAARGGERDRLLAFIRTASGVDGFGTVLVDGSGARLMTGAEALEAFAAEPQDQPLARLDGHDALTQVLLEGPFSRTEGAEGNLRGVRKRIHDRLSGNLALSNASRQQEEAYEALYRFPLLRSAETMLRKTLARRGGVSDEDLLAVIGRLHTENRLVFSATDGGDYIRIKTTMGVRHA